MGTEATLEREAWDFRNVTRSVWFWPRLDSITIVDAHPEDQATFACEVEDPTSALDFAEEDEIRVRFGGTKIFAGHIRTLTLADHDRDAPRVYVISANDYTPLLAFDVIDTAAPRAAESAADRIDWILGFHSKGITLDPGADIPAVDVDKGDYLGRSVLDALEDVFAQMEDTSPVTYWVDFDKVLHIERTSHASAPFALAAGTASPPTSYPFWSAKHSIDSTELGNAALVMGDKAREWYTDGDSITDYGRREFSVDDGNLKTSRALDRAGGHALSNSARPVIDGVLTFGRAGIRAGMAVEISHYLWPRIEDESPYLVSRVEISAVDPHDEDGTAQLRVVVGYTDRYRIRFRPGAGGGDHGDAADDDGDPFGYNKREASYARDGFVSPAIGSEEYANPVVKEIGEVGGYHNLPYTTAGCPIGNGGWSGWQRQEGWYEISTPTLGDDVVAMAVDITAADPAYIWGVAGRGPYVYGVAEAAPSGPYVFQFEPLGNVPDTWPDADARVIVPRSFVVSGGTTYFVIAPGWSASRDAFFCAQDLVDPSHGPCGSIDAGGEGNSGRLRMPDIAARYRVMSASKGLTPWVAGRGDVDGSNREFTLTGWTGKGVPRVKVNGLVQSADDFTYDAEDATVTLNAAPEFGDEVAFQYQAST